MADIEFKRKKLRVAPGKDCDFTDEEMQALTWCQVVFALRVPDARRTLADRELVMSYAQIIEVYRSRMTQSDLDARRNRGMRGLMEKGVVEGQRDGNGDWQPTVIHEELLDRRAQLVTGNFQ